jgi:hypothetical protein
MAPLEPEISNTGLLCRQTSYESGICPSAHFLKALGAAGPRRTSGACRLTGFILGHPQLSDQETRVSSPNWHAIDADPRAVSQGSDGVGASCGIGTKRVCGGWARHVIDVLWAGCFLLATATASVAEHRRIGRACVVDDLALRCA